eukprot:g5181.t1
MLRFGEPIPSSLKKIIKHCETRVPQLLPYQWRPQSTRNANAQPTVHGGLNDFEAANDFEQVSLDNSQTKAPMKLSLKYKVISPNVIVDKHLVIQTTHEESDAYINEAVFPVIYSGNRSHLSGFISMTHHGLVELSEQAANDLLAVDLCSRLTENKIARQHFFHDMYLLIANAVLILENIINEIDDERSWSMESGTHFSSMFLQPQHQHNTGNSTSEALVKAFVKLSGAASQYCSQLMCIVANQINEYENVTDCASVLLQQITSSLFKMCSRIKKAEESFVVKKRSAVCVISWYSIQEKNRAESVMKLIEAVNSYTLTVQDKFLDLGFGNYKEGLSGENRSNLDTGCQRSWTWLKDLSGKAIVLCPYKAKEVYICLLNTFNTATERLWSYHQVLHIDDRIKSKTIESNVEWFGRYKTLVDYLTKLKSKAQELESYLENCDSISIQDRTQIVGISKITDDFLNEIRSKFTRLINADDCENQSPSESWSNDCLPALNFVKEYFHDLLTVVTKDSTVMVSIKRNPSQVLIGIDNLWSIFQFPPDPTEPAPSRENYPSNSASASGSIDHDASANDSITDDTNTVISEDLSHARTEEQVAKVDGRTPFSNTSNHPPPTSENNNETSLTGTVTQSSGPAANTSDRVGVTSEDFDSSLDRSQGSMPDVNFFDRSNNNGNSRGPPCDGGSSSNICLMDNGSCRIVMKTSKCLDKDLAEKRIKKEAKMHQRLNSDKNIVRFLGTYTEKDESGVIHSIGIKMEWCQLGDLRKAIQEANYLHDLEQQRNDLSGMSPSVGYMLYKDWVKRMDVIVDVASALKYMHSCNVVHRDVTCRNILLDRVGMNGEFRAKLCDFERAFYLKNAEPIPRRGRIVNSVPWMCPEVLRKESYGLKADVYSIGTVLWELMYLANPWTWLKEMVCNNEAFIQLQLTIGNLQLPFPEENTLEIVPEFPRLIELVKWTWQADPNDRPTMADFYNEVVLIRHAMQQRITDSALNEQ